jgi:hypothetical protein
MSLFYFFVQGIPECMGMVAMSLAYARVPLRWGLIFITGIVIAIINYLIRTLPFTFGFHLPIVMFLVIIIIIRLTNASLSRSIIAVFSSLATLALLEFVVSSTYFSISNLDPQDVIADERLWAIIGIVQAAILNMIALFIARIIKPVEGAWRNELPGIQQEMGE